MRDGAIAGGMRAMKEGFPALECGMNFGEAFFGVLEE